MVQQSTRLTAEDLYVLPDDQHRYELVRGELRKMPPASAGHGHQAMILGARLHNFVEDHHLGYVFAAETGFILSRNPDSVRAPDVSFVRGDRVTRDILARGFLPMAPDLAVEVVSPSETAEEVDEKVNEYISAGTEQVWLVYNRTQTIRVHYRDRTSATFHVGDVIDGGETVPDFRFPLSELFGHTHEPSDAS